MGSGHILVYAFDVLMQIYESAGYTQRDAAKSILENNLFGLDIDERAAQLAYFAVLMKARQYNRRILNDYVTCNVYAIRESNGIDRDALNIFGEAKNIGEKLVDTFIDAKEYGSILNVNITADDLSLLDSKIEELKNKTSFSDVFEAANSDIVFENVVPLLLQAKLMVQKYDAVITNPPYMGAGNMNKKLSNIAKKEYPLSKNDLCTIFMEKCINMTKAYGVNGFMTSYTWMFIASFEKFRNWLLSNVDISSLVQPEYHAFFESANVPICAFTLFKMQLNYNGTYIKLSDYYGADVQEKYYLDAVEDKKCNYRYYSKKSRISKIDGWPIAYWATDNFLKPYDNKRMDAYSTVTNGLFTCDNNRFLRLWYEIGADNFQRQCDSRKMSLDSEKMVSI